MSLKPITAFHVNMAVANFMVLVFHINKIKRTAILSSDKQS